MTGGQDSIDTASGDPCASWRAVLSPQQAADAVHTAMQVAQRLRRIPSSGTPTSRWQPMSLAEGAVGAALVCGYVGECADDPSWSASAHGFMQQAASAAQQAGPVAPGLFDGLAGMGFTAWALSQGGQRYQRLTASVDRALHDYLTAHKQRRGDSPLVDNFDVVSGLSGIGVYFLARAHEPDGFAGLTAVTKLLLGDPLSAEAPVQWHTPKASMIGTMRDTFPDGCFNCGLAHGIPGPLSFLAQAWMRGVRTPGLHAAIEGAAGWLLAQRIDDEWGPNWPTGVALDAERGSDTQERAPARAAWCYGCPGVARALWLAGVAVDRPDWRQTSVEAIRSVYRRPASVRLNTSPGLCHGIAGLLQITLRFYHDTHDDEFAQQARTLSADLIERFEPDSTFGYRNSERGDDAESPGFLDGAGGAAVALLAAATGIAPVWDRVMLIA